MNRTAHVLFISLSLEFGLFGNNDPRRYSFREGSSRFDGHQTARTQDTLRAPGDWLPQVITFSPQIHLSRLSALASPRAALAIRSACSLYVSLNVCTSSSLEPSVTISRFSLKRDKISSSLVTSSVPPFNSIPKG